MSRCTWTGGGKEVSRTGMYLKVSSDAFLEGGDAVNPTRLLREGGQNKHICKHNLIHFWRLVL